MVTDPQGVKGGLFSNTHCSEYGDVQLDFNPHIPLGTLFIDIYGVWSRVMYWFSESHRCRINQQDLIFRVQQGIARAPPQIINAPSLTAILYLMGHFYMS